MTNDDFQLLLDNIRSEIGYQGDVTKVSLKPEQVDELKAIEAGLEVEGRKFSFDPSSSKLTIDSTDCETTAQE